MICQTRSISLGVNSVFACTDDVFSKLLSWLYFEPQLPSSNRHRTMHHSTWVSTFDPGWTLVFGHQNPIPGYPRRNNFPQTLVLMMRKQERTFQLKKFPQPIQATTMKALLLRRILVNLAYKRIARTQGTCSFFAIEFTFNQSKRRSDRNEIVILS